MALLSNLLVRQMVLWQDGKHKKAKGSSPVCEYDFMPDGISWAGNN
jgi:hypothetical protein